MIRRWLAEWLMRDIVADQLCAMENVTTLQRKDWERMDAIEQSIADMDRAHLADLTEIRERLDAAAPQPVRRRSFQAMRADAEAGALRADQLAGRLSG